MISSSIIVYIGWCDTCIRKYWLCGLSEHFIKHSFTDSLFPPFSEDFDINPSLHPKMKRNIYKIIAYICFQVSRARKINVWVECNTNISMFISSQNLSFHYFCFKGAYLHYRIISLRREIYTTGVTGGAETAYPSGAPEFTRSF